MTPHPDTTLPLYTPPEFYFIFDVESVGLHGEAFAVAGGVYRSNGDAVTDFYFACPISEAKGSDEDRKWVEDNVTILHTMCRDPEHVRIRFWPQWEFAKATYPGIVMAVECGWPVEVRFLLECINDAQAERNWDGPYPLMEIASYMAAAGMNPMATYERSEHESPPHEPLADARLSARLLSEALLILKGRNP